MPNFNAGAIEGTLDLDRSPFTQGLRLAREQAQRFEDQDFTAHLGVELDGLREAIDRLNDAADDRDTTINADADTGAARTKLAVAARDRTSNIFVKVANLSMVQSQLRSLGNLTMSLSGANVIQARLRTIRGQLENLDQLAYRAGGLTYLFGNIANVALTGTANITTLIGSLGALGGALIPLPVIAGSLATAIGVGAIAFTGFNGEAAAATANMRAIERAVQEQAPAWNRLVAEVRETFWEGMADSFSNLANTVLPTLHDGLVSTAESLSGFGTGLMDALAGVDPSVYSNIFAGIASSIDIANGAISPLVSAFATLGSVGSDNLDRLASWFVTISDQFNAFISGAAADGRLQGWIDNSAVAFGDLGTVIGQIGGILNGITDAFSAAGSTTLGTLADTLTRVHDIINTPAFQTGLTTIFSGVLAGAAGLSAALGPIGDALSALSPLIGSLAQQIGETLGSALSSIAGALATPAFQTGLGAFFDGIAAGIAGIEPFLPQIAAGIGAIGQVAGAILANVGPALGALLAGIGDALVAALPSLLAVADTLGGALLDAITTIAPSLVPLVGAFGTLLEAVAPVVAILADALAQAIVAVVPVVVTLIDSIMPLVTVIAEQLAPQIGELLVNAFTALANIIIGVAPILDPLVSLAVDLVTAFAPLLPVLSNLVVSMTPLISMGIQLALSVLTPLIGIAQSLIEALAPSIPAFVDLATATGTLVESMMPLIQQALPLVTLAIQTLMPFITLLAQMLIGLLSGAMQAIVPFITNAATTVTGFADSVQRMTERVKGQIDRVISIFTGIRDTVMNAFSGASSWLSDAASDVINGFIQGIRDAFGRVRETFSNLTDMIPDWKGPRERDMTLLRPAANMVMGGFIGGIEAKRRDLRAKLGEVTDDIRLSAQAEVLGGYGPVPSNPSGTAGNGGRGIVYEEGAIQIKAEVNVPNQMNEEQVGTHVAAKLGNLLSSGVAPVLPPVEED